MNKRNWVLSSLVVMFFISACGESLKEKGSQKYLSGIKEWQQKRINNLKKENGWLNLVGLYWLKEGENKFGSGKENDIVFPDKVSAQQIGKFILKDSIVTVEINNGINVLCGGQKVTRKILLNDNQNKPTILEYGPLRWFVIKRGDKYGIRLRNLDAPLVKSFTGTETFPINYDWNLEATFESYNSQKVIAVPNILGTVD